RAGAHRVAGTAAPPRSAPTADAQHWPPPPPPHRDDALGPHIRFDYRPRMTRATAVALVAATAAACGHMRSANDDAGAPPAPDAPPTATPPPRSTIDLDAGWKFLRADAAGAEAIAFDDGAWMSVDVPHTWNAIDGEANGAYYRG